MEGMLLLLIHAAATLFMTGLIWFVQVVHYPLFAEVGAGGFARYEQLHSARTTWVVAPVMLVELAAATLVLWLADAQTRTLAQAGAALVVVVWLSTFFLQVPRHAQLTAGFDASAHAALVSTNWIRTVAWSVRSVLALLLLVRSGRG